MDFPRRPDRARRWRAAFTMQALALTASLGVVLLDSASTGTEPADARPVAATTKQIARQISVPRAPMG